MTKITLELDVERLRSEYEEEGGYSSTETIEEAIVNAAAVLLVNRVEKDFHLKVNNEIAKAVEAAIREKLVGELEGIIDQPMKLYNEYGRPTGKEISLRERILEIATTMFQEKVDDRGNRSSYGNGVPRWQYHVNEAVKQALDHKLKKEVEAAIKEAKDKAIRSMGTVIADLLIKEK